MHYLDTEPTRLDIKQRLKLGHKVLALQRPQCLRRNRIARLETSTQHSLNVCSLITGQPLDGASVQTIRPNGIIGTKSPLAPIVPIAKRAWRMGAASSPDSGDRCLSANSA